MHMTDMNVKFSKKPYLIITNEPKFQFQIHAIRILVKICKSVCFPQPNQPAERVNVQIVCSKLRNQELVHFVIQRIKPKHVRYSVTIKAYVKLLTTSQNVNAPLIMKVNSVSIIGALASVRIVVFAM